MRCVFWNLRPAFILPSFRRICNMFTTASFDTLYHTSFDFPCNYSKHQAFWHFRSNQHHVDHDFNTNGFVKKLKKFEVQALEDAVKSDHALLTSDLT